MHPPAFDVLNASISAFYSIFYSITEIFQERSFVNTLTFTKRLRGYINILITIHYLEEYIFIITCIDVATRIKFLKIQASDHVVVVHPILEFNIALGAIFILVSEASI